MSKSSLDSFKLYYEELESKVKKTAPVKSEKRNILETVKRNLTSLPVRFYNALNKLDPRNNKGKKRKKITKLERQYAREQQKRGIMGLGLLLVVVSIAYSTYITRVFVDTSASLIALAPQVVFALITLVKAFSKLYK